MSLKNANKIDTNKYELEIEVDKETFNSAVDKAFKRNASKMNVPGFRKGKAPRAIIERLYGEGVFYEDAVNMVYPTEYEKAVDEAKIEPVDRADIEVVNVGNDGLVFKAKVTVKPEVELGEYKGLKAEKETVSATDDDVDAEISRLQERNARLITIEDRASQKGDVAVIDFEGFVDGVPFEGGKAEKYSLELGAGNFIPGFEEQVEGHKAGDEFDVNVTFPEDYSSEELAGKPAVFKIKLHEIKFKELPAVDDEFAKDVSEFDTIAELRDDIRKKIIEHKEGHAAEEFENKLIDQIIDGLKAEIPEVMVDQAVDNMVGDMDYRLQSQGLNMKTYLQYTGMEMDDYKKSIRPQAERQVKIRLALEKVAELENLEATAEDLENEYKKLAERFKVEVEKVKAAFPSRDIEKDLKMNKAIDFVKANAVTVEPAKKEAKAKKDADAADEKETAPKKTRKSTKKAEPEA